VQVEYTALANIDKEADVSLTPSQLVSHFLKCQDRYGQGLTLACVVEHRQSFERGDLVERVLPLSSRRSAHRIFPRKTGRA
jgi:hypothetical protein